jgi:hypothetical protein
MYQAEALKSISCCKKEKGEGRRERERERDSERERERFLPILLSCSIWTTKKLDTDAHIQGRMSSLGCLTTHVSIFPRNILLHNQN